MSDIAINEIVINSRKRAVNPDKVKELAASIEEIGLMQPVVVTSDNRLIAGAHRIEAFKLLGRNTIPATIMPELDGLHAELAEIDENLIRNEGTRLERSEMLAERKRIYEALYPETKAGVAGGIASGASRRNEDGTSAKSAFVQSTATAVNASKRTIQEDVQIATRIPESIRDTIRDTPIADSKQDLLALARLPEEKQREITTLVTSGEADTVASAISQQRRIERVERVQAMAEPTPDLDAPARFPVIYADPPWHYDMTVAGNRAIENHYPTMNLDELCALPVGDVATDDAVLFLWITSPKLDWGMDILSAWGFKYRTCAVWVKDKIGMGFYFRQQHELLWVATRGNLPAPLPETRHSSVINAPRLEHSKKPAQVYEIIETMYPEYPKIELFARSPRAGWNGWGNQYDSA